MNEDVFAVIEREPECEMSFMVKAVFTSGELAKAYIGTLEEARDRAGLMTDEQLWWEVEPWTPKDTLPEPVLPISAVAPCSTCADPRNGRDPDWCMAEVPGVADCKATAEA